MLDAVIRKAASLAISALLIYVPQERYQKELDNLPSFEDRVRTMDLRGWSAKSDVSPRTGQTYHYYSFPSQSPVATTLVMLHGFNTDGAVFLNLSPLADSMNLVALNFPERSPFYRGNMSDFHRIVDDFLSALGLDTIFLMGNSIGGAIAMHYAGCERTVAIKGLVLLSSQVFGANAQGSLQTRGMADKLLDYPDYKLYYLLKTGKSLLGSLRNTRLGENAPEQSVAIKHVDWYRQVLRALYYYDGSLAARRIRCPVLSVHGAQDRLIPLDGGRTIPALVAQDEFHIVEGAGHSLVYSDAGTVLPLIRDFCMRNGRHTSANAASGHSSLHAGPIDPTSTRTEDSR